jgi:hypothetical protein
MKKIAALVALGLVAAIEASLAATPKAQETVQALAPLAATSGTFLSAKLQLGKEQAVSPGEPLETELRSTRPAYITFVVVDAHGVAEVSQPDLGGAGNLLAAGTTAFHPAEDAGKSFAARPPLGAAQLMVLATEKPVTKIGDRELRAGVDAVVLAADRAPAVLSDLRAELTSSAFGEFQLVSLPYTVRLTSEAKSYTAEQIVQYFAHTMRNADRPRLEGWGVNFALNSADILPESRAELEKWGRVLRDPLLKDERFVVGGHTDDLGTPEYNQALSLRRAQAVRDVLISTYGVDASRLEVRGYGESQPLVSRTDDEGRAMNRRVDFERATRRGR